jgi:hypothetical protein
MHKWYGVSTYACYPPEDVYREILHHVHALMVYVCCYSCTHYLYRVHSIHREGAMVHVALQRIHTV